jgi:hypothetical protein
LFSLPEKGNIKVGKKVKQSHNTPVEAQEVRGVINTTNS